MDYWPRRLDLAALKAGNLAEVLNLAPWGGVLLQLPPVRLSGVHGWPALGAAVGELWLRDIVGSQVPRPGPGVRCDRVCAARTGRNGTGCGAVVEWVLNRLASIMAHGAQAHRS